ncbi:type II secretion system F family protein [Kineococcus aurantiacus]|uniref:Tight adherence protein B n=1 Tax=Kineococcus aurantiacus TaxID=37633 RepID=A0A7Y9J0F7_9ACTN|nr:type II secretion system F family protein [Kineococcus aurantiacus]NYD22223.1 tight adherence protein B [Kineococcus aurantiacus]
MSPASPGAGLLVAALLLAAAAVRPRPGPPRAAGRRPRLRRRRPPVAAPDDLTGARTAERAAALLRAGVPPATAWEHAADGAEVPPPVRAVWRLVTATGAPAAEALDACAAGVRADAAARAAVRTALAGARVSARTVSLLPLLGLVLGAALGAPPWTALAGSAAGRACAVAGTALLLAGRWWSGRLVAAAERAAG